MYSPTRWERFKDLVRYTLCRHKNQELKVVSGGSDEDNLKEIGRFKQCLDCDNNISGWL